MKTEEEADDDVEFEFGGAFFCESLFVFVLLFMFISLLLLIPALTTKPFSKGGMHTRSGFMSQFQSLFLLESRN